jgi:hypothetical protein
MTDLLTVLPFSANDGVLAEALADFIFLVNRRSKVGHCLLAVAGDVHGEMEAKVRIAAEVAFETVEVVRGPRVVSGDKNLHINALFKTAAEHVQKAYRLPWLWLEPDCAPVDDQWMRKIKDRYFAQPKRYCGSWLKQGDTLFFARVGVYPANAYADLASHLTGNVPFNLAAGSTIIPQSTKTYLVAEIAYNDESVQIRPDSVLVHHDKNAILITKQREHFELRANKRK